MCELQSTQKLLASNSIRGLGGKTIQKAEALQVRPQLVPPSFSTFQNLININVRNNSFQTDLRVSTDPRKINIRTPGNVLSREIDTKQPR